MQNTNLTRDVYPDYTKQKPKKKSLKQCEGKQLNQKKKKKKQMLSVSILLKKTYEWPINTRSTLH